MRRVDRGRAARRRTGPRSPARRTASPPTCRACCRRARSPACCSRHGRRATGRTVRARFGGVARHAVDRAHRQASGRRRARAAAAPRAGSRGSRATGARAQAAISAKWRALPSGGRAWPSGGRRARSPRSTTSCPSSLERPDDPRRAQHRRPHRAAGHARAGLDRRADHRDRLPAELAGAPPRRYRCRSVRSCSSPPPVASARIIADFRRGALTTVAAWPMDAPMTRLTRICRIIIISR